MGMPKSTDKKINKLTQVLSKFSTRENLSFCLDGEKLDPNEVFASTGFLMIFLVNAKELYEKIANGLYTHKELMEAVNPNSPKMKKARRLTPEQYQQEEEFLNSQSMPYKFPLICVKKDGTYIGAVPFVDPKKKFPLAMMAGFAVESLLQYAKTYSEDKSLLIDGMIPIEPLFEKVQLDIKDKKVKLYPQSMLTELENYGDFNTQESVVTQEERKTLDAIADRAREINETEPTSTVALSEEDNKFKSQIDDLFS